jgi:hypothetical protein
VDRTYQRTVAMCRAQQRGRGRCVAILGRVGKECRRTLITAAAASTVAARFASLAACSGVTVPAVGTVLPEGEVACSAPRRSTSDSADDPAARRGEGSCHCCDERALPSPASSHSSIWITVRAAGAAAADGAEAAALAAGVAACCDARGFAAAARAAMTRLSSSTYRRGRRAATSYSAISRAQQVA